MGKFILFAPLGCIYYPIEILPEWLQLIAKILPLVHIFEEMRNILINDIISYTQILIAITISFFTSSWEFLFFISHIMEQKLEEL